MLKAVIFDLDGVITDTAEYHYRAWQRLADEVGLPFDRQANEQLRGVSREQSLRLILGDRIVTDAEFQAMMNRKNGYYQAFITEITTTDLLPGSRELLEYLRAQHVLIAIGSASKNAPAVVKQLRIGTLIDFLGDGHAPAKPKPAPDLFLFVAEKLRVTPVDCVVVEDAAAGITAAQVANMGTVGIGLAAKDADIVLTGLGAVDPEQFLNIARDLVE